MLAKAQSAISLFTCGCLMSVAATPVSIGIAVTNGKATVDGMAAHGNSTLFRGSVVRTENLASDLMLHGGTNLVLQPGSAATIYSEHAVLQQGTIVQRGSNRYSLIADGLKIASLSPQGALVVGVRGRSHLEVAAQGVAAEIRDPQGVLLAHLEAGKALAFDIRVAQEDSPSAPLQNAPAAPAQAPASPSVQPPSSAPSQIPAVSPAPEPSLLTVRGILREDHPGRFAHYLLTDTVSQITYELQGQALDDLVGKPVEATGTVFATTPVPGASKVISVAEIHVAAEKPTNEAAAAAPSTPAAATPSETPATSTPAVVPSSTPGTLKKRNTTMILVIAGAAGAAVVGVAAGLSHGSSPSVSPQ